MSAEDIIAELDRKKKLELDSLNADCEKKIEEIRDKSQKDLQKLNQLMSTKLEEQLRRLETTLRDEIIIAKNNVIMDKKNQLLQNFWEKIEDLRESIRTQKDYEKYIEKSIELSTNLLGKDIVVTASKKDKALIDKISGNYSFKAGATDQIGIVSISKDGKRSLSMTLDSILEEKRVFFEEFILHSVEED
jgi:vacuolar-type H+-ATPase subunit E/Vma4